MAVLRRRQLAVGSTGTVSQGLHLEKGNAVAIRTAPHFLTDHVKMLVQNSYCDLTLDGVATSHGNGQRHVQPVKQHGASRSKAPPSRLRGGVAFDVYSFGSYTGANVTVIESHALRQDRNRRGLGRRNELHGLI
jgi:hypothetical protein